MNRQTQINLLPSFKPQAKPAYHLRKKILGAWSVSLLISLSVLLLSHGSELFNVIVDNVALINSYVTNDYTLYTYESENNYFFHKSLAVSVRGLAINSQPMVESANTTENTQGSGAVVSPVEPRGKVAATSTVIIPVQQQSQTGLTAADVDRIVLFNLQNIIDAGWIAASVPAQPAPTQTYAPISYIAPDPQNNFSGASIFSATDLSSDKFATRLATISSVSGSGTQCLQTDNNGLISGTGSACGAGGGSYTGTTQGSVLFVGSTNTITENNNFYWDNVNHRLGIGDATPAAALTVGSGDLFQINSAGAIAAATGITSSGVITFSGLAGSGTQCLQVDNAGTVSGVGAACGAGGANQTPWTSDIDAAGFALQNAGSVNGLVVTPNTGVVTSGIWNGTPLTDAYVSNSLTSSIFVASDSTTDAVDLATTEVAGILPVTNGGTGAGDSATARINLGLGTASTYDVGTSANQVVTLNGAGKIDTTLLPSLSTGATYVVSSQAAMLALSANVGDVAVRTDESKTYILIATPASTLSNWQELLTPTSPVQSVAGKTGTVLLDASDITAGTFNDARLSNNVVLADGSRSFTGAPTWSGTPSNGNELVTKDYADALAQGLLYKDAARVATTANITLSGLQTIDGVTLIAGDRVLVKRQNTASQNGLYTAASGAWTRTTDADTSAEVKAGLFAFILEGTTNSDTAWVLSTNNPITLGTTALNFVQYSTATGAQKVNAGDGLVKTGNTIDVVGATNRIQVTADLVDISANYVGQTSITTLGTITTGTWNGTAIGLLYGGTGATTSQGAINNISQLTTNGDLLYNNGTNSTRLARGSNGQCLTSNTTTILWGSCGSGGMAIGGSITSATAGSVLYAGASGVLAQDNSNFFWDNTNHRLGIGTNAPGYLLDVNKSTTGGTQSRIYNPTAGTGNFAQFIVQADTAATYLHTLSSTWTTNGANVQNGSTLQGTGVGGLSLGATNASGDIRFYAGGATNTEERMRILSGGDIVMGTTTAPSSSSVNLTTTKGMQFGLNGGFAITPTAGGGASFFNFTGAVGSESYSTVLTVQTTTGNVGIGDATPNSLFTVGNGDLFQVASNGNLTSSNAGTWTLSNDTNMVLSGGVNGLSLDTNTFSVDATSHLIGIGTTAPSGKLQIVTNATSSTSATVLIGSGAGNASSIMFRPFSGDFGSAIGFNETFDGTNGNRVDTGYSSFQFVHDAFSTPNTLGLQYAAAGVNPIIYNSGWVLNDQGNFGIGDITPAAKFTVGNGDLFQVNSSGAIAAATGITSSGTVTLSGLAGGGIQCLQTSNTGVISGTGSACGAGGGSSALSSITAASATNSINNANFGQTWAWDSLTSGSGLTLSSASTAAASSTQTVLNVTTSGTNSAASQITYGAKISNTHAGTLSTNVGLYATATGGTTANYAAIFDQGDVGIGTTSPGSILDVRRDQNASTIIRARNDTNGTAGKSALIATLGNYTQYASIESISSAYNVNGLLAPNSTAVYSLGATAGLNVFTYDSANLTLGTNNTARVTVNTTGNVGIGTASPGGKLEVLTSPTSATAATFVVHSGAGNASNVAIRPFSGDLGSTITFNGSFDGTNNNRVDTAYSSFAITHNTTVSPNILQIGYAAAGANPVTYSNGLAITDTGSVRIGNGNATQPGNLIIQNSDTSGAGLGFNIFNEATATNSISAIKMYGNNGTVNMQVYADGLGTGPLGTPGGYIGTFNSHPVGIFTANTERIRVLSTGNVGIGDTSPASLLTVGSGDLFQVNSSGAIAAATGLTSSGTITLSGLGGGGIQCLQTSNTGVISGTGSACGAGGGSSALSSITAASTTNSIDNTLQAQTWDWSTLTTQNALTLSASGTGLTSGSVLKVTSATTGAVSAGIVQLAASGAYTSTGGLLNVTATASTAGTLVNLTNNTANFTGNLLGVSATGVTSGFLENYTLGSTLTTGGLINSTTASYNHTTTQTGKLVALQYNDASTNASGVSTTTGIGLTPTWNTSASAGTKVLNGLDVNPSYTACGTTGGTCTYNGVSSATASVTQSTTNSLTLNAFNIPVAGALVQNTAAGTIAWNGMKIAMPNITQSTGTVTSTGIKITGGTVTSGTSYALTSDVNAGNVGIGDISPAAMLTVGNGDLFQVNSSGAIAAATGLTSSGTITFSGISGSTQCLHVNSSGTLTGTGSDCGSVSSLPLSTVTAAVSSTSINSGANDVTWAWNSLSTGTGFTVSSSSVSSGNAMAVSVNSTAAASNTQTALNVSTAGINSTNAQTTYGIQVANTHTNATSGTNVGLQVSASGATTANYALLTNGGNVGIGDSTPVSLFTVGAGDLFQVNSSGAIAAVAGITSSSNYVQSAGTMSVTSANTSQTTTSSVFALNANSLTSGTAEYIASSSLTSGTMIDLQSNGTAALTNQTGLNIAMQGTNSTSAQTTYGARIVNNHAGTTSTNIGLQVSASNGTTANYALLTNGGNVGIGDTTPVSLFTVGAGDLFQVNSSGAIVASTGYLQSAGTMSVTSNLTTGTGSSSAMYLNSSSVTSGTLMNLTQSTSTFNGTGLLMNFGTSSGTFSGNFADLQVNGTSKFTINKGTTTASGSTAIAGVFEDLTLTNSTASGFQFGNRLVTTVNGSTAGTEVGQFIRMIDNTVLDSGQTVRGLEVQAFSGTNTNGVNTGIASYGYTFGIQGTTTAQASSQTTPAAVFADLDNGTDSTTKTRGNAIRAYTNDATSADLVQFYQESSAYTGTGLLMDFGNNSGSYAGNFIDLKVSGSSRFAVSSTGTTTIASSDLGNGSAGPVLTVGRNSNATNAGAGSVNLLSQSGTAGYIWQDNAGNLRINTTAPTTANDTAGTVVGAQTSTRDTKQDITDYTDFAEALQMVTAMPLHTFRYIKDVQGYGDDSPLAKTRIGYIADEVPGIFMWGNTIDQVSVNGILLASVKELDTELTQLKAAQPNLSDAPLVLKDHLYLSEDSVGEAKILSGVTSVRITFVKPYEYQPIVTTTPEDRVGSEYWISDKDDSGFTINIAEAADHDVTFDWHSFAGEAAKLTVSDGTSSDIVLVVHQEPAVVVPDLTEPTPETPEVLGDQTTSDQEVTPTADDQTAQPDETTSPTDGQETAQ